MNDNRDNEIRNIQKTMDAIETAFDRMNNPHKYEGWKPCPTCGEYAPCVRSMTVAHRRSDDVLLAYQCPNGHRFRRFGS